MFVGLFMSFHVMLQPTWVSVITLSVVCLCLLIIWMREVLLPSFHHVNIKQIRQTIREWAKAAAYAIHR